MQSWWGPIDNGEGGTTFSSGEAISVVAFGARHLTDSTPSRDLLSVSLVSSPEPISCDGYAAYLGAVAEAQDYLEEVLALPAAEQPANWFQYVCQTVDGAAADAFGGAGSYRAVEALLDVGDGGPTNGMFRAAPYGAEPTEYAGGELLVPSSYVSRIYERSRHGDGILPDGGDGSWVGQDLNPLTGCALALSQLVEEFESGRETYPDRGALALSAATHRYYHHYTSQEEIGLAGAGSLQVGYAVPDWESMGSTGADAQVTMFGTVARAPDTFPYSQLLLSTETQSVAIEPCQPLQDTIGMIWPEVSQLGFGEPTMGDDDDSAP